MDIEQFRQYCLSKKGTSESFPFDDITLVFKVMRKMFAITSLENEFTVNLKCDPDYSHELREKFPQVQPGYHMNKKHWNTVEFNTSLGDKMEKELIDHSYNLVVSGLTKKLRDELE